MEEPGRGVGVRWPLQVVLAVAMGCALVAGPAHAVAIKTLLIGSHDRGPDHWITAHSLLIENLLKFSGIPYEFFDIHAETLDQDRLNEFRAVLLEGYSISHDATDEELQLLAENMENGTIVVLLSGIVGQYDFLNDSVYGALDVTASGSGENESSVALDPGARVLFDYDGDDGYVMSGGHGGSHVGLVGASLSYWTYDNPDFGQYRCQAVELALTTWLTRAFGTDARVTLPVISLRLDDTQAYGQQHQEVTDYLIAARHRIRASGFLVTDFSAYQGQDSLGQSIEQSLAAWGSVSLHGKDHGSVGAEGEDRDYETQVEDMRVALDFIEQHFTRTKRVMACPNNSWNVATLHAMASNDLPYHSAYFYHNGTYADLYRSVFDVDSELDRERLTQRGLAVKFPYYPLRHVDATGDARIYSLDWTAVVAATMTQEDVLVRLEQCGLQWWTPLLTGAHYYYPGPEGANENPSGWMEMIEALMQSVDRTNRPWRRWVDTYDFARATDRFDRNLQIDDIDVSGDCVTYQLSTDLPIRYLTLRARREGARIHSVVIDGVDHAYFGDDYVHLPELTEPMTIEVWLTTLGNPEPHVTAIDPSAVIEAATRLDGKLHLAFSGEFAVQANLAATVKVFTPGTTRVFANRSARLVIDATAHDQSDQVELALAPRSGWAEATVQTWDADSLTSRIWQETAAGAEILVGHEIGDLTPNAWYAVRVDDQLLATYNSGEFGRISFEYAPGVQASTFSVVPDPSYLSGLPDDSPAALAILDGRPNPFNATIRLSYSQPQPGPVRLRVYSLAGKLVRSLGSGPQPAGAHTIDWDGRDDSGIPAASGVYFCLLDANGQSDIRRVALVK